MLPVDVIKTSRSQYPQILFVSLLFSIILPIILFLTVKNVYSVDITLAWDKNTEPDLDGYRSFCREEGQGYDYNNPAWEGIETSCTIYSLKNNTNYCVVARAFDTSGNESDNSNKVCYLPLENLPPIANAGFDQSVNEFTIVTLNGSQETIHDYHRNKPPIPVHHARMEHDRSLQIEGG